MKHPTLRSLFLIGMLLWVVFAHGQAPFSLPYSIGDTQATSTATIEQYVDNQYAYPELWIKNGLPKGGQRYTAPDGRTYTYAIFWTELTNPTDTPIQWTLAFPSDSIPTADSSDNYFKLILLDQSLTLDQLSLSNYGLTHLTAVLDKALQHPASIQQTLPPKESRLFYVVTLFKKGVQGTVRAGL